jgi:hypothetical protein
MPTYAARAGRRNPIYSGGLLAVLMLVCTMGMQASLARAAAPPKAILDSFGKPNGPEGGQLSNSRGLAVNVSGVGTPAGSVFVAEGNPNHRISQFDKDGKFIRTWGYDVIVATRPDTTVPPNSSGTGFEICDVTNGNVASDCKSGVAGVNAGQLSNPQGIAIDQISGYLYVTSATNRRIDVFSGSGQFAGAFGWGVDSGAAALEFCTTLSGCQAAAAAGAAAGNIQSLNASGPSVDLTDVPGTVYVPDVGNARMSEYSTTIDEGVLTAVSFVKAFGWDVDPAGGTGLEICTTVSGCKAGTSGAGAGQFGPLNTGSPSSSAVDSTGAIYVASGPLVSGTCSPATPCRIQKFAPDASAAADFGPSSPPGQLTQTSGASNAVAGLAVAVDPSNDHVFVLFKEGTTAYRVNEYDSAGNYIETHPSSPLTGITNNLGAGLGVGLEERVYSNMGGASAGEVVVLGPLPEAEPLEPDCEAVSSTDITCSGEVIIPEVDSGGVSTTYRFEYSVDGVTWKAFPNPDAPLGSTPGPNPVEETTITGLKPNTFYAIRLCATTGSTRCSSPALEPTPAASPTVISTFADEVTQTAAELGAYVNPNGAATTYFIEWGPTPAYGNRVPAGFERQIGGGISLVISREPISGLDPETVYYFKVVAKNDKGPEISDEGQFETLNSCGLTDGRCYEQVSPVDKGPVGGAGEILAQGAELRFQAHPNDPRIAYQIAYGLPSATSPSEVLYQSARDDGAWATSQVAPALSDPSQEGANGNPSFTLGLSEDLGCGIFASTQRLTPDTPEGPLLAAKSNLFRRSSNGSWTVLSNLEPTTITLQERLYVEYKLVSVSSDCQRIVYRSSYTYGLPGVGVYRLYEWNAGTLSSISEIPGPGGPEPAEVVQGAGPDSGTAIGGVAFAPNFERAVSRDGARVYFTAVSKLGGDLGQEALFLRDNSGVGIDVSQSQTATSNNDDSHFQIASTNGDKVFFLARHGLAGSDTSTGPTNCANDGSGCDLYRYAVSGGQLTDLTPHNGGSGPDVAGVVAADEDGEVIYFAARAQLVPGKGVSEGDNAAEDQYSLYRWQSSGIEYVSQISEQDASASALVASRSGAGGWTARTNEVGDRLLFESRADPLGLGTEGRSEAYLYDATDGSTVCVSCRRDGKPTENSLLQVPLGRRASEKSADISPARFFSADGSRVFFKSQNRLAVGATEGRWNLYQWENGQVSFLASSPPGSSSEMQFAGSSETGDDVYFTTLAGMIPADRDEKADLYDARVGGGFPEPEPPVFCSPLTEGSCQGNSAGAPSAVLPPASSTLNGAGNGNPAPQQQPPKKNKKSKKKKGQGKKGKGKKKGSGKAKSRTANKNGRAGK